MDQDDDESTVSARISCVSSRVLAKAHQCSTAEIEAAVDRRLDYELDNRQRLRLVKLSVERIMALMAPFFEKAVHDKDVAAGGLCVKLEERLALLLGLDQPLQSRVDVYAVEQQQKPDSYAKITAALLSLKHGNGDGDALAPPSDPSADDVDPVR